MISLENICKYYKNKKNIIKALDNINLKISKGDFITIVGQSGSGKSTLLNILGGLSVQTSGNYYFNNIALSQKIKDLSNFRRENIGFIVQNFALIDYKNIFNNIALPLLYKKKSKECIKTKVYEFADRFGITEKLENFPSELSGGECQRAAIARALISNPNILLADEPTGDVALV